MDKHKDTDTDMDMDMELELEYLQDIFTVLVSIVPSGLPVTHHGASLNSAINKLVVSLYDENNLCCRWNCSPNDVYAE